MGWHVGQRVRLQHSHRPPARPPLKVRSGELVTVGDNDDTWPAYIWTENSGGVGGWVPERHLRRTGEGGAAELLRDYDTTELSADAGAVVAVVEVDEESGWLCCRADDGQTGWVPINVLQPC
jgi:uncharacterized protein YgiM (DUF1202 family)